MLRRIRYDITGKPFSFLFQSVMYTVLFTFLLGSLLMVSLSDVFDLLPVGQCHWISDCMEMKPHLWMWITDITHRIIQINRNSILKL